MNLKIILGIVFMAILLIPNANALVYLDNCQTLNSSETYVLNESIETSTICFDITNKNDIIFDGDGYYINNSGGDFTFSISNSTNIEIKNTKFYGLGFAVTDYSHLITVDNNTFERRVYNALNNVSNFTFSNNFINDTDYSYEQMITANENLINVTINDNEIYGYCYLSTLFGIYSFNENLLVENNIINTTCVSLTTGYKNTDEINRQSSGYIIIRNNEFYNYNSSSVYSLRHYAFGENLTVEIYDNKFVSNNRFNLVINPRDLPSGNISIYNNNITSLYYTSTTYNAYILDVQNSRFYNNVLFALEDWNCYVENTINFTSENNIYDSFDDSTYGLAVYDSFNVIINNETIRNTPKNFGILFYNTNAYVDNSFLNASDYYGLRAYLNSDVIVNNSNIYGNNTALVSDYSSILNVYNSNIDGRQNDLRVRNDGLANLYNTTFDYNIDEVYNNGSYDVYWKVLIDNSLLTSSVELYDYFDNLVLQSNVSYIDIWIKEYNVNDTDKTDFTPHILEWSKENYYTNETQFTLNKNFNFILNLIEKVNITMNLPFDLTGMFLSKSECLDDNTLYREYKKQTCIHTDCYELTDVQTISCAYGCKTDLSKYGDDCFLPDYQTYVIAIIIFVLFFLGLAWLSKK